MTESWFIDTSALLRYFIEDDPHQPVVKSVVDRLFDNGQALAYTPQVVREIWAVLTRPKEVGGYGHTPSDASLFVGEVEKNFILLPDVPQIHANWLNLVTTHNVSGRQVHDANHVAAMMTHGLSHVLTLDDRDFKRYSAITVVHPADLQPG